MCVINGSFITTPPLVSVAVAVLGTDVAGTLVGEGSTFLCVHAETLNATKETTTMMDTEDFIVCSIIDTTFL
jgi:hypothetical protein